MHHAVTYLLALALLLGVVSLLVPLATRLRLPLSMLLAALGTGLGLAAVTIDRASLPVPVAALLAALGDNVVEPELFLYIFLPPLLFVAGLSIDVRRLVDEFAAVFTMAVVAVLVCCLVVGLAVYTVAPVSLLACLLLGAIVATTDPAAVVGIFRDLAAPKRLSILVEGESLFNDAAAIAIFVILVEQISGTSEISFVSATAEFVYGFAGGLAFGFIVATLAARLLDRLDGALMAEVTFTVSICYLTYIIGHGLGLSGVVAVVAAALTLAAQGPIRMSPANWAGLQEIWHQIDFWANSLIFVLAAMLAVRFVDDITFHDGLMLAILIPAALMARGLVLFGLLPGLSKLNLLSPVNDRYKTVILWGGLRGAVTMVLAIEAASNFALPEDVRHSVGVVAIGFVLFTLFVNAPTLGPLMRFLKLDQLSNSDLALRNRVMTISRITVREQLEMAALAAGFPTRLAAKVANEDNHNSSATTMIQARAGTALSPTQRIQIGLLILSNREKELYFGQFNERAVSRNLVARLAAKADRLVDVVKTQGVEGYSKEALRAIGYSKRLEWAHQLHRMFGFEQMLSRELADRFEMLLMTQLVTVDLERFNYQSVRPLLGAAASSTLNGLLAERMQAVQTEIAAIELEYGDFADHLRVQYLERTALRLEEEDYRHKYSQSLISREVYRDLIREIGLRRMVLETRPPLDLGLKLSEMVRRVPIFASLSRVRMDEIARLLKPRLAIPGEKIVTKGEKGDGMYFIAAGQVEVKIKPKPIRLRSGDYFGEMALLTHQVRTADVVAVGFCHLLSLGADDFKRLIRRHDDLRVKFEDTARARIVAPIAADPPKSANVSQPIAVKEGASAGE